jgi:hypothetical protein
MRDKRYVRHWIGIGVASDANDFEAEHCIYREDAVLEGRLTVICQDVFGDPKITAATDAPHSETLFTRAISACNCMLRRPRIRSPDCYTVSIMEFSGGKVARETQYFADPFEASAWPGQWVERTDT